MAKLASNPEVTRKRLPRRKRMSFDRQTAYYVGLVHELCKLQVENEWVEFKYNNDPRT